MRVLRNRKVKSLLCLLLLLGFAEGGVLSYCVRIIQEARKQITFDASAEVRAIQEAQYQASLDSALHTILLSVFVTFFLAVVIYLATEWIQSKVISRFQEKIESNLHGHREMDFEDLREGEFESLESTIRKMVNAHFAQEDALQDEQRILENALAEIAHQIKTPLATIRYAAIMLDDPDLDPFERQLRLERINEKIDHIGFLLKTLLDISRLDAGVEHINPEVFSAEDLVLFSCRQLSELIELKDMDIQLDVPSDIELYADRLWLAESLTNIIKNCIEHTEPGGTIYISVKQTAVYVILEVRDTGSGIAPEDKPHIFERFYRGKDADSTSVGIGLYLSRSMIHRMGGTLTADNHEEGGAVFTIRFDKVNV